MKNVIPYILLMVWLSLLGGCRETHPSINRKNMEEWLSQEPDSCLSYFIGRHNTLFRQRKFAEMEQLYAHILRSMPQHPKESKNLNYLTGTVLFYYYDALIQQDKAEERLTDSLLNSSHPYYTGTMRPELLATSAKLYQVQNRIAEMDSLGRLFLSLPPSDDPRRNARTWYNMAWALEYGNMESETFVRMMEYAMACCREANGEVDGEGDIYSFMGYLYWKDGALEKATQHIQKAIDWYIAHPDLPRQGLIETYLNLSRVYVSLRLFDKALEANALAVEVSKAMGNWTLEEIYRMRATTFEMASQADSALFYVEKAMEYVPEKSQAFYMPKLRVDRLGYYFTAHRDSLAGQIDECLELLKDTAVIDFERKYNLLAYYGMALQQVPGREREGVKCLEESYRNFLADDYPEGILFTGDELIRAYIRTGLTERISDVFITYTETADSLQVERNTHAAIVANIRYETGRKEQENRALTAEVSLKQRTLIFTWLLVGLLTTLLVIGGLYLRQRQRYLHRISDARLSQISELLRTQQKLRENNGALLRAQEELRQSNAALSEAQQELSRHNASLKQELHVTSHKLEKTSYQLSEVTSRLDSVSKQRATSDIRVKISTELLNSDKEAEFRRSFTAVYPDYLPALHRLSADITPTDELIAMLLLLELSNNEIALTLGISKNGVNKARSRMRQRLGLKSEVVLEEFLKGI
ncbi:helix-turn-helix transcriptional regulator [Parabacteroides pacaensis]|uniref:helix-turn-helix transcriptional regulator n=1 Tax=Parabacteroides pacaensis TaxID=2086575 RepID=UPI000D10BA87|nr:hypothetical protein [Parabacteroides pacaensis]